MHQLPNLCMAALTGQLESSAQSLAARDTESRGRLTLRGAVDSETKARIRIAWSESVGTGVRRAAVEHTQKRLMKTQLVRQGTKKVRPSLPNSRRMEQGYS